MKHIKCIFGLHDDKPFFAKNGKDIVFACVECGRATRFVSESIDILSFDRLKELKEEFKTK